MLITTEQQRTVKDFYMKVKSGDHDSVFMFKFNARNREDALQLTQGINEQLNVYDKNQLVFLEYKKWDSKSEQEESSFITLNILKVYGSLSTEFRVCKSMI